MPTSFIPPPNPTFNAESPPKKTALEEFDLKNLMKKM